MLKKNIIYDWNHYVLKNFSDKVNLEDRGHLQERGLVLEKKC